MATTTALNGATSAIATDITLDAAIGTVGSIIQIEDELLVIELRASSVNPQVRRGQHGTTAASHADNATVTLVYPQVATVVPTPTDTPDSVPGPTGPGGATGPVGATGATGPAGPTGPGP